MGVYFTADLHLGHRNICRYTGRPFGSVEEMNAAIVARWNETVRPEDTVWILGDFAMGSPFRDNLAIAESLNGKLNLVAGNHDRCSPVYEPRPTQRARWLDEYHAAGFVRVHTAPLRMLIGERSVILSHYPYERDGRHGDAYAREYPVDNGAVILHGHTHGIWRRRGRQIDAGLDAWAGELVPEATVAELIADSDRLGDLGPIPWQ